MKKHNSPSGRVISASALVGIVLLAQPCRADILVDLDATKLAPGPLAAWTNSGTIVGDFTAESATPNVAKVQVTNGVTFNGVDNWYIGPTAPASVTGNGNRSVEAWVFNPVVAPEESVFAWSRRGGGDGTNVSFGHGSHDAFGAVGHWGNGPDVGWDSIETANDSKTTGDDREISGQWTYIVYTYDGAANTTAVYTNGVLTRSDVNGPMNAWAVANDNVTPLPFVVANQNEANGTRNNAQLGSMTIARVRALDTVLAPSAIANTFDNEAPAFNLFPNNLLDTDGDTLDDRWEEFHFGVGNLSENAMGNPDMDGLSTGQEYVLRTFPNDSDTDDDGLIDGDEVNRMVAGAPAPTNPLDADTDKDGLSDGAEVNRMVAGSPAPTNPLVADTDGDGFSDFREVNDGTDPLDKDDFPILPPIIALDATALAEGPLATWTNAGTVAGDFTAEIDVPSVTTVDGVKGVTLDGANDWYVGPTAPVTVTGNNSRSVEAWVFNPEVGEQESVFAWSRRGGPDGTGVAFIHGTHDAFGAVGHWGNGPDVGWDAIETDLDSRTTGDDREEAGVWTHIAYVYNGPANTTTVYTNGVLTRSDLNGPMNAHALDNLGAALHFVVGTQNEANGTRTTTNTGSMTIARINVYADALSGTLIAKHYDTDAAAFGRFAVNFTDSEPDGLDDAWEQRFFMDLDENGSGDFDSDGLIDADEHALRYRRNGALFVNPNDSDSDDDGATDGQEFHHMFGGLAAPTDLLDPDSDDDGLTDGEEINRMVAGSPAPTNPLSRDTDGEGFSDFAEVQAGSDPLDPNSFPAIAVPAAKHRYSFSETGGSGTTLVDSLGGANGVIIDGGVNDATVGGGLLLMAGGGKDVSDYPDFPDGLISGAGASGTPGDLTVQIWATPHSVQNWSRVFDFGASPDNFFHMSWTRGGTLTQNEFRYNVTGTGNFVTVDFSVPNVLNTEVCYAVVFDANGGATGNSRATIYKNGQEVRAGDTDLDLVSLSDVNVWLGRSQFGDNTANASYNEFRVYDVALSANEVLASYLEGADAQPPAAAPFVITAFSFDRQAGTYSVTFNSEFGVNYDVQGSTDLAAGNWFGIIDGVATGTETTLSGPLPDDVTDIYYIRVTR